MVTSNISDTDEPTVDVLVIGAGSSGAVVTHTAAAAGLSVICVEQGDCVNPSDFPANHPEWELLIQHDWAHDPERARTALGLPRRRHRLRHVAGDVQRRRREFRLLRRRVATEAAPRTSASRHSTAWLMTGRSATTTSSLTTTRSTSSSASPASAVPPPIPKVSTNRCRRTP